MVLKHIVIRQIVEIGGYIMIILPTKEEEALYKRLEPYIYFDQLECKLKEDVPDSAKKDWELRNKLIEEQNRIWLAEQTM